MTITHWQGNPMITRLTVNPELITLARQSRGITQSELAKRIGISAGVMSRYESGTRPVTHDNLTEIASILDYPATFFTRRSDLEGPGIGETFHRSRQNLNAGTLNQAYSNAEIRRLEVAKLLKAWHIAPSPLPQYPVELFDDDPEKIARSMRVHLDVPPGPVFNMTKVLERAGCIVIAHDFGTPRLDGFSRRPRTMPCFFHINSKLPPDRWRWTLAHELGHLVMHFEPMESPKLVERQADQFAGEFLAPAHEIRPALRGMRFQKLAGLKREWKISMQALVMRAYELATITDTQRRAMYTRLSKAGYRTREPEVLDPPAEPPNLLFRMAKFHMTDLHFSRIELKEILAVNETDFHTYYHDPEDILNVLSDDELPTYSTCL